MDIYLEFKDETSNKFWQVTVEGQMYVVNYGKIGNKGISRIKNASCYEEATEQARKLADQKINKGYVEVVTADTDGLHGWFEQLQERIFKAFTAEIQCYPVKNYKSVRMTFNGNRFALGLVEEENSNYWQSLHRDFWDDFEPVNGFYDFGEDCEDDRDEWPFSYEDCFYLEGFLISVAMANIYPRLTTAVATADYLKNISSIMIDRDDDENLPFEDFYPDTAQREALIATFSASEANQKLILDMWADTLKGPAIPILEAVGIKVKKPAAVSVSVFESCFDRAQDLWSDDKIKKAIRLLEPEASILLNTFTDKHIDLLEEACGLLASCYKEQGDDQQALYWYECGFKIKPKGMTALNLMGHLKIKIKDFEKLVMIAEQHGSHLKRVDKEYRFYSLFYLAFGYLHCGNKKSAMVSFKKAYTVADNAGLEGKLEELQAELVELSNKKGEAAEIAVKVLSKFYPEEGMLAADDSLQVWWKTVPERIQYWLLSEVKYRGKKDAVSEATLLRILNIELLDFSRSDLDSLEFIKPLQKLDYLYIKKVDDISPLSELSSLKKLSMDRCKVGDLAPLKSLTRLKEVRADNCEILDVSALSGLTQLVELHLRGNEIEDIEGLSTLINLEELDLTYNPVKDISPLKYCVSLRKLSIEDEVDEGLDILRELPHLYDLNYGWRGAAETFPDMPHWVKKWGMQWESDKTLQGEVESWLKALKGDKYWSRQWEYLHEAPVEVVELFFKVTHLSFKNDKLMHLKPLANFRFVDYGKFTNTGIRHINELSGWQHLQMLTLEDNFLEDLSALKYHTELHFLNIQNCGMNHLEDLSENLKLRMIKASNNNISDLSPMGNLKVLTTLIINDNVVDDLSGLARLPNLQKVEINNNEKALDLSPLASCPELLKVECKNKVGISGLDALLDLPRLRQVISGGAISKKQINAFKKHRPDVVVR